MRLARMLPLPAAVLLMASMPAAAQPPMAVYRSAHVTLQAPRSGDPGRIANDLERAWRRVREFGLPVPARVTAICYGSTAEFMRGSGGSAHHLALAVGDVIHLQPASVLALRGGERGMTHEMAHVALLAAARSGLPRWLNEGIAMRVAGEKLPASDGVRSLTELDLALEGGGGSRNARGGFAGARGAYATAGRLVDVLVASIGRPGLLDLVRRVAAGEEFGPLFERLVGMSRERWEAWLLDR